MYSTRIKQNQLENQQQHQTSSDEHYNTDTSNSNLIQGSALDRGPFFDISASKNVTALVGKTSYLNCRIKNLGNKTVSLLLFLKFLIQKKLKV